MQLLCPKCRTPAPKGKSRHKGGCPKPSAALKTPVRDFSVGRSCIDPDYTPRAPAPKNKKEKKHRLCGGNAVAGTSGKKRKKKGLGLRLLEAH